MAEATYISNPVVSGDSFAAAAGNINGNDAYFKQELDNLKGILNGTGGTSVVSVVFGTYTGDGEESQTINLGVTPLAVEVYRYNGMQYHYNSSTGESYTSGGLAIAGSPCYYSSTKTAIEVINNGFKVYYNMTSSPYQGAATNNNNVLYYYKAYINLNIT